MLGKFKGSIDKIQIIVSNATVLLVSQVFSTRKLCQTVSRILTHLLQRCIMEISTVHISFRVDILLDQNKVLSIVVEDPCRKSDVVAVGELIKFT